MACVMVSFNWDGVSNAVGRHGNFSCRPTAFELQGFAVFDSYRADDDGCGNSTSCGVHDRDDAESDCEQYSREGSRDEEDEHRDADEVMPHDALIPVSEFHELLLRRLGCVFERRHLVLRVVLLDGDDVGEPAEERDVESGCGERVRFAFFDGAVSVSGVEVQTGGVVVDGEHTTVVRVHTLLHRLAGSVVRVLREVHLTVGVSVLLEVTHGSEHGDRDDGDDDERGDDERGREPTVATNGRDVTGSVTGTVHFSSFY